MSLRSTLMGLNPGDVMELPSFFSGLDPDEKMVARVDRIKNLPNKGRELELSCFCYEVFTKKVRVFVYRSHIEVLA